MTFKYCLRHIFKVEGGFVNHPADAGGPTKYGITIRTLAAWRGKPVTVDDVRDLTETEAGQIYEANYWKPLGLSRVKSPKVAALLMDQGVNRGIKPAVISLQWLLNRQHGASLIVDGVLGPKTAEAINSADQWRLCIEYVIDAQATYLDLVRRNPTQNVFLRGWIARTWGLLGLLF